MAASVTTRAQAHLPSPAGKLSAAGGGQLTVVISAVVNPRVLWVAYGAVVAGPPATYADIAADWGNNLFIVGVSISGKYDADAGLWAFTVPIDTVPAVFSDGDEVWVAIFEGTGLVPEGGNAPTATAGPFTVIP